MVNLYTRIESDFKKKSKNRRSQIIFIFASIIYLISMLSLSDVVFKNKIDKIGVPFFIFSLIGAFLFLIGCYVYIFCVLKFQYEEKIGIGDFFDFEDTIHLYHIKNQQKDVEVLKEILHKNGVNTRPKVLEVLRHYQCMIPKNINSGQLFSVLALVVAILALLTSDNIINSVANSAFVLEILFLAILMYLVVVYINKKLFSFFGKKEFYLKLEGIISEIYINYHIKEKVNSKKEK